MDVPLLSDWVCLLIWTHFPAVVCMWLLSSSLGQTEGFLIFQYNSASLRFISCLLCSFLLVRYSVCHYQKHTACLIYFLEKINCLFVLTPVNLLGSLIWDYGKVLFSEMHISLNDFSCGYGLSFRSVCHDIRWNIFCIFSVVL